MQEEESVLKEFVQQNDLIFVGVVERLGDPPANWSGRVPAFQQVHYRVEKVIKGDWNAQEIDVEHVVVSNSPTAEPGDSPRLSSKLYANGAKLIVSAMKTQEGRWRSMSERRGALAYSDETLKKIEALL